MKCKKDTKEFLDKFNLECLDSPGIHKEIGVRIGHIEEELAELKDSITDNNLEEVIDALVDIIYVAAGTANLCGFDLEDHWDEVHNCNMKKVRGKTKRGSAFDVKKPEGWTGPNHTDILANEK